MMHYSKTKELPTGLDSRKRTRFQEKFSKNFDVHTAEFRNYTHNKLDISNKNDLEGAADVMKKAIVRAEKLDPDKEALFIIQDSKEMALVHYKIDSEGASFKMM